MTAGYRPSPAAGAGADTCTPEERNKERARKAARTRAERYGAPVSALMRVNPVHVAHLAAVMTQLPRRAAQHPS